MSAPKRFKYSASESTLSHLIAVSMVHRVKMKKSRQCVSDSNGVAGIHKCRENK